MKKSIAFKRSIAIIAAAVIMIGNLNMISFAQNDGTSEDVLITKAAGEYSLQDNIEKEIHATGDLKFTEEDINWINKNMKKQLMLKQMKYT